MAIQPVVHTIHCINPDCPAPYPQPGANRFCLSCGAPLRLSDRYIPLTRLGSGGFAQIYTVWDLQTQTERVLKVLIETAPKAIQLFEQEAAVLSRLRHPGIPQVEPQGYFQIVLGTGNQMRQLPCLVMEKITGKTLDEVLTHDYPQGCPEALVIDWFKQALDILQTLHHQGIIHRDLKPSNLMLRQGTGQLVAIDFGGAKQIGMTGSAANSSTRLVSPGYSPPEQIVGEGVSPATDFYALGRTIIHLLTGQYPADLEDPTTGRLRWRHCAPVSSGFAALLDRMVELDVQQRPSSVAEIQQALRVAPVQRQPNIFQSVPRQLLKLATRSLNLAFRLTWGTLAACLTTVWEMVLGGLGATLGTLAGFAIAYGTPLGSVFAQWVGAQFPGLLGSAGVAVVPQLTLLFAIAGIGTAWGISLGGGFSQKRRLLFSGIAGAIAFSFGGLIFPLSLAIGTIQGILIWSAIAPAFIAISLGLPSHHLIHALISGMGTSSTLLATFSILQAVFANLRPELMAIAQTFATSPTGTALGLSILFFSSFAILYALWLGISYYICVPLLRFLGWR
ncbi:protein kinase domain-containing protein [Geitlerinema calcuttense]|uniref:non-specific serine/threonine protein kinase n=1 Tax=Geitlerinema calcuttense NRMC-F 0142 TaxID=2922238 RepID=A0ABT7M073_9CYAN|nr:protein kinase [Geitlerinema calcuttense]MDL5057672.1 protein kinase [Geitlerinema calcuttense NRMC-F 0142]